MAEGFVHTVHEGGRWVKELEGGVEFGGTHSTKEQAVAASRVRAMQNRTKHLIHNEDLVIQRTQLVRQRSSFPGWSGRRREGLISVSTRSRGFAALRSLPLPGSQSGAEGSWPRWIVLVPMIACARRLRSRTS